MVAVRWAGNEQTGSKVAKTSSQDAVRLRRQINDDTKCTTVTVSEELQSFCVKDGKRAPASAAAASDDWSDLSHGALM